MKNLLAAIALSNVLAGCYGTTSERTETQTDSSVGGMGGSFDLVADEFGSGGQYPSLESCAGGWYPSGGKYWLYYIDIDGRIAGYIPPYTYVCVPVLPENTCVYRVSSDGSDHLSDDALPFTQNPPECD